MNQFNTDTLSQSIDNLTSLGEVQSFSAGDIIYNQGDDVNFIYYLEVGVVIIGIYDEFGTAYIPAIIPSGDIFGESEIFGDQTRYVFAKAAKNCKIVVIPKDKAIKYLNQDTNLLFSLVCSYATTMEFHAHSFIATEPHLRLAKQIVIVSKKFGIASASGVFIDLPLSLELLSELSGLTSKTIRDVLKQWSERKWIDYIGSKMTILEPDLFEKYTFKL